MDVLEMKRKSKTEIEIQAPDNDSFTFYCFPFFFYSHFSVAASLKENTPYIESFHRNSSLIISSI